MNETTYLNLLRMVKPFMKGSIMKVKLTAILQYLVTGRTDRLSAEITTLSVLPQDPALWGRASMVLFQSTRAKICSKLLSYMLILVRPLQFQVSPSTTIQYLLSCPLLCHSFLHPHTFFGLCYFPCIKSAVDRPAGNTVRHNYNCKEFCMCPCYSILPWITATNTHSIWSILDFKNQVSDSCNSEYNIECCIFEVIETIYYSWIFFIKESFLYCQGTHTRIYHYWVGTF